MFENMLYFTSEVVSCHFVLHYKDVLLHSFLAETLIFCSIINKFYCIF